MKPKVRKIITQLESVDLLVKYDDDDKLNPNIEIRRNELKKPLCEIIFDKKGNIHSLCIGKKQTRAAWIKLQ